MKKYSLSDVGLITDSPNYSRQVKLLECDDLAVGYVDYGIAEIVLELNNKGYETSYSCSGLLRDHWVYDDVLDENYIEYIMGETGESIDEVCRKLLANIYHHSGYIFFKENFDFSLPDGLYWHDRGIYQHPLTPERTKIEQWAKLKEIVTNLDKIKP